MTNQHLTSHSVGETFEIAKKIANDLQGGEVIALNGELGSGKTTFVQGLAQSLKVDASYTVTSPTYTLIQSYPCHRFTLHHMDFYRLKSAQDAHTLGLEDYFKPNAICVIEWANLAQSFLPKDHLEIFFEWKSPTERLIFF
ncbi:MAG: tRNA (adenosine(37)-N6)-threonylcarbamoyltransferase complex ATPase subunit type 1 TsaE [Deltaproteobacteria bacterium RIFCSPHIGHO2_02_FULL_40_11]|nr:MAG: tRNA (adenosine(37)-N6)-threonylcarbamoyltransferase complex ATPase subunit type 1 TsaE [Deltaproteobacteria bacterium RIFCSPHIGHO2_02_FULL_40_11]